MTRRKIRYLVLSKEEYDHLHERFGRDRVLVIWKGSNAKKTKEQQIDA